MRTEKSENMLMSTDMDLRKKFSHRRPNENPIKARDGSSYPPLVSRPSSSVLNSSDKSKTADRSQLQRQLHSTLYSTGCEEPIIAPSVTSSLSTIIESFIESVCTELGSITTSVRKTSSEGEQFQSDTASKPKAARFMRPMDLEERRRICEFLDFLLIDMEAFEKSHTAMHPIDTSSVTSYPAALTQVYDLGPSSLYVEWICFEKAYIDHFKLEIDGEEVPKKFPVDCNHAVVFDINVTARHECILTAVPKSSVQAKLDMVCDLLMEQYNVPRKQRFCSEHDSKLNEEALEYIKSWKTSRFIFNPNIKYN